MLAASYHRDAGGSLSGRRRLRPVPEPDAAQTQGASGGGTAEQGPQKRSTTRRKCRKHASPNQPAAHPENATSPASEGRTTRLRAVQPEPAEGGPVPAVRAGKTLGVRPATIVPASEDA